MRIVLLCCGYVSILTLLQAEPATKSILPSVSVIPSYFSLVYGQYEQKFYDQKKGVRVAVTLEVEEGSVISYVRDNRSYIPEDSPTRAKLLAKDSSGKSIGFSTSVFSNDYQRVDNTLQYFASFDKLPSRKSEWVSVIGRIPVNVFYDQKSYFPVFCEIKEGFEVGIQGITVKISSITESQAKNPNEKIYKVDFSVNFKGNKIDFSGLSFSPKKNEGEGQVMSEGKSYWLVRRGELSYSNYDRTRPGTGVISFTYGFKELPRNLFVTLSYWNKKEIMQVPVNVTFPLTEQAEE